MPVGEDEAGAMLRPWLGGLDVAGLPMPRMIAVEIDPASPPDFDALREAVERAVPQASLDDHRMWMSRLVAMAQATVLAGIAILVLVVVAAVLTVVFATRGPWPATAISSRCCISWAPGTASSQHSSSAISCGWG